MKEVVGNQRYLPTHAREQGKVIGVGVHISESVVALYT